MKIEFEEFDRRHITLNINFNDTVNLSFYIGLLHPPCLDKNNIRNFIDKKNNIWQATIKFIL